MFAAIAAPLIGGLFSVIDKTVEDKDQAGKIKARLNELALSGQLRELEAAASIIVAEAGGESWLQRNWRPMLMCLFGAIVANNYIIGPYLEHFIGEAVILDLPPDMWELLKIGVGGYVIGRSTEKGVRAWKSTP